MAGGRLWRKREREPFPSLPYKSQNLQSERSHINLDSVEGICFQPYFIPEKMVEI
jgi:hypothetical protein